MYLKPQLLRVELPGHSLEGLDVTWQNHDPLHVYCQDV